MIARCDPPTANYFIHMYVKRSMRFLFAGKLALLDLFRVRTKTLPTNEPLGTRWWCRELSRARRYGIRRSRERKRESEARQGRKGELLPPLHAHVRVIRARDSFPLSYFTLFLFLFLFLFSRYTPTCRFFLYYLFLVFFVFFRSFLPSQIIRINDTRYMLRIKLRGGRAVGIMVHAGIKSRTECNQALHYQSEQSYNNPFVKYNRCV